MNRNSSPEPVSVSELTHCNIESILCLEDKEKHSKPMLYKVVATAATFAERWPFFGSTWHFLQLGSRRTKYGYM